MEPVTDNTAKQRYEYVVGEHIVFADYRLEGTTMHILYVEAPVALRGSGAAGKLMQGVLESARKRGLRVVPVCGYAATWILRHPEFHDLKK